MLHAYNGATGFAEMDAASYVRATVPADVSAGADVTLAELVSTNPE